MLFSAVAVSSAILPFVIIGCGKKKKNVEKTQKDTDKSLVSRGGTDSVSQQKLSYRSPHPPPSTAPSKTVPEEKPLDATQRTEDSMKTAVRKPRNSPIFEKTQPREYRRTQSTQCSETPARVQKRKNTPAQARGEEQQKPMVIHISNRTPSEVDSDR